MTRRRDRNRKSRVGLTALHLALPSGVPARGDIDEAVRRDSRRVEDALVVAEAGFVVAVCVLGVEEFDTVVGGWFGGLSFYFGELGRLRSGNMREL
jgi:hypothetical protein